MNSTTTRPQSPFLAPTAGPETIRYAWSGTPGDPLTRQYNGGTVLNVSDYVQFFSLDYSKRAGQMQGPPSVLLIVQDAVSMDPEDTAKKTLIESWGFSVQMLDDDSTQSAMDIAAASSDVIYVSQEVFYDVSPLIKNSSKGIVSEDGNVSVGLGFGKSDTWFGDRETNILSNAHEITAPFAIGQLTICDSSERLLAITAPHAPGAVGLSDDPESPGDLELMAIEADGGLYGGGNAAARRVSMPWGSDTSFDFREVNAAGKTLMRRAIVWAGVPVLYFGVHIVLNPTGGAERIRTEVQVFNTPKVNAP